MPVPHFETIADTSLVFLYQTRTQSQLIYIITLLAITCTLGALPFIYTTISIKGVGFMQSAAERTELLAPVSGRLEYINISDNQKVIKGSTLIIIDGGWLKQQRNLLSDQILQLNRHLKDSEELTTAIKEWPRMGNHLPKSKLYTASWQQYIIQFQNATNAKKQTERIYLRYRTLYLKNVITLSEFEQYKFNYEQALSDQNAISEKFINQWQIEANQYANELRNLQSRQIQLDEQIKQYSLKATISGSIQNLTGLQKGSYVYANQKLGEISADNSVYAYSYVKPSDIGLLKKAQPVRIQVDAFDSNQWGILTGTISDISDDVIMLNQLPYFKIKCQLDRNYLQLKNGYRGYVKKGMTLRTNFTIAERSFYQLLYDNVNNWVNAN